jgi:hypothetical protein
VNVSYFIPEYNSVGDTGLERLGSGKQTGTLEGAQLKTSEIKENKASIK